YNAWHMSSTREDRMRDSLEEAQKLSVDAPENEKAYIAALSKAISGDAHKYADAMRELSQRYPDDPDAATLYAAALMTLRPWNLWNLNGAPGEDTLEITRTLEEVLKRWPNHVGANHLYIHALEGSPFPQRALPSANRLETLVRGAGHLVHMPAHIYFRTGDYQSAVKSSLAAVAADKAYARECTILNAPYLMGYANHNLYFLVYAASMSGEFKIAYSAAKELEASSRSQAFRISTILVLLRFARWEEILALPKPDSNLQGIAFFWHYARGCAFAHKGNPEKAGVEESAMNQAYAYLPPGRAFGMYFNDWSAFHQLAEYSLKARVSAARGDVLDAIQSWQSAIAVQDQMKFDDLPDWYYPVRESLGAELLHCGKAAEAEKVFRDDLSRTPRNPRSLYGLWEAMELQKQKADAAWVRQAFEASWKGALNQLRIDDF
ncbi:MAG TPA: hypothetical protein VFA65_00915, partial [Bryobacteraceae bacterium]|nr:hypothetical protein [Bryobacteraceae bacterium]